MAKKKNRNESLEECIAEAISWKARENIKDFESYEAFRKCKSKSGKVKFIRFGNLSVPNE